MLRDDDIDNRIEQLAQDLREVNLTAHRIQAELDDLVTIKRERRQLQEVEAILEYLNVELRKLRSKTFRQFIENYNRTMSSRDADKYVDGDENVCDLTHLVNEFALVRNKYLGFIKALDAKQFQLNNITKIRAARLEDVTL